MGGSRNLVTDFTVCCRTVTITSTPPSLPPSIPSFCPRSLPPSLPGLLPTWPPIFPSRPPSSSYLLLPPPSPPPSLPLFFAWSSLSLRRGPLSPLFQAGQSTFTLRPSSSGGFPASPSVSCLPQPLLNSTSQCQSHFSCRVSPSSITFTSLTLSFLLSSFSSSSVSFGF